MLLDRKAILWVDPKIIRYISPVAGAPGSRYKRCLEQHFTLKGDILIGEWDTACISVVESSFYRDYLQFKSGNGQCIYDWSTLYNSMKTNGYLPDTCERYVEVGVGRTGDLFLADGRHRLICAQELNIERIPVVVVYRHPAYKFANLGHIKDLLVPEYVHNLVTLRFPKSVPLYQTYPLMAEKFSGLKEFLPKLAGSNVLDIGCNAAFFVWSIMKYAESYVGLDINEYWRQGKVTVDSLRSLWGTKKVSVLHMSLEEFLGSKEDSFNSLFLSYVLYWLSDKELSILEKDVFPKCNKILISNRTKERSVQKNSRFLNRDENVIKFLTSNNFKVMAKNYPMVKENGSYVKGFSVFYGYKETKNEISNSSSNV